MQAREKTPSPRFGTLIVRGEPANAAGRFPRTETVLYDGSAADKDLFQESVTQKA